VAATGFVTIYNPVNGLPWECPDTEDSLAYYTGEKGFTKKPNKNTPADAKATSEGNA
jgi:hypothetical protein